jgi:hypothetical protein
MVPVRREQEPLRNCLLFMSPTLDSVEASRLFPEETYRSLCGWSELYKDLWASMQAAR